MKKTILSVSLFVLAAGSAMLITSCSKDDTAPLISITGDNPATISLNETYVDEGATANDDEDGDITANITMTSDVNKDLAGSYTVTYTVSDKEGNESIETREVNVVNDAAYLNGTYTTTEAGSPTWTQTVSASSTVNNRVIFSKFANYSNNDKIYANVVGSTIEIPTQTGSDIGPSACDHRFTQDGSNTIPIAQVSGKWNFSIAFTDETLAGGTGCSATTPVSYEDFFTQQ